MAKVTEKCAITADMIDELAVLRDKIRVLSKREEELKKALREDCAGVDTVYRGYTFVLKTKFVTQERLDTAAAREALGEQWCSEHTKTQVLMTIDCTELI